jgi:hypothetical protein
MNECAAYVCCFNFRAPSASSSPLPSPAAAASPTAAAPPPTAAAFPLDSLPFLVDGFVQGYVSEWNWCCLPVVGTPDNPSTPGTPARTSFKYWTGDDHPWRNSSDEPVHDAGVIAAEEKHKAAAEHEDSQSSPEERARDMNARGVRVDFLLALTRALNLWDWKTWQVKTTTITNCTQRVHAVESNSKPSSKNTCRRTSRVWVYSWFYPALAAHS